MPKAFSGIIDPKIVPSTAERGSKFFSHEFAFEDTRVKLQIPLDLAVYAGAKSAEKSTTFIGRSQPDDWLSGHYRSFVEEQHQDAFFTALREALHAVRDQRGLDESRYVELVTTMAQSLEYRIDTTSLAPKFPIETFGDAYGDCDDKTLLAAAVLSRDGYDVAILFFEPEEHVALGIRAPGLEFRDTGYAFAEMTQPSLVGTVPDNLDNGQKLESEPEVIRIGSGERSFGEADQVVFIQRRLAEIRSAVESLAKQVADDTAKVDSLRAELEAAKLDVEATDDPASDAAARARYNALAKQHNDLVAKLNERVERHNELAKAGAYASEHPYARPQVYEQLRNVRP